MTTKEKIIEQLYETKEFIVPNGGDIQKVEITYKDWLWIEKFLSQSLDQIHNSAIEDCLKALPKENGADVDLGYNDWLP